MTEAQVVALMQSSKNEDEWNANCDTVKKHFGGYPKFWFPAIMMSGLAHAVRNSWIETGVRGLLPKDDTPGFKTVELLPPTPEEIENYHKSQKE